MAKKRPGIPLEHVRPFYQVVVYTNPKKLSLSLKAEVEKAAVQRQRKGSAFKIVRSERQKSLQYVHVKHTTIPSWVRGETRFKDVEHDEAMLYRKDPFVFLHANCRALLDLLTNAVSEKLDGVPAADIEKVLSHRRPEIRSLGMQNLNAPGRSAPEGKIHFARDATYTLSPTQDAMFGFRHAFAVERGQAGAKSKPFGCSAPKRKVWGTWVSDSAEFVAECDQLSGDLTAPHPGSRPWVLAAPIKDPPADAEPIAIYADYSIHRKGTVWLEDDEGDFSAMWECYLSPSGAARFEIQKNDGTTLRFELEIKQGDAKMELAYPEGCESRKAKLCDDSGELERRRSRDLVQLLNSEEAFTVVLTRGISYRFGGYWKNDGLDQPFTRLQTDIDWKGIDIKKESLDKARKDTIGDAILRYLKADGWPEVVICDDGSNEVADYLAVGDGRIALVHAKYSADSKAGLRVGDLQEVLAQCLKNLQFFQWVALEPHLDRLVDRTRPEFTTRKKVAHLLQGTYENQRAKRECWIVQPGISADKLSKRKQNKIHSLLNYAESACLPGNVEFRFFCSP